MLFRATVTGDEDKPERQDAYRLERIEQDGAAVAIAVFYSAREALIVIPSLDRKYRLMLGDRMIWPNEASPRYDGGDAT